MTANSDGGLLLGNIFFNSWTQWIQTTKYDADYVANSLPIMIALWIQLAILFLVITIGYTKLYEQSKNA